MERNKYSEKDLNALVGKKIDLSPWAYVWRKDRKIQERPEAEFIPKRVKRQNEVYRTLLDDLGPDLAKSIYYKQDDLLEKQLPDAKGELLTGIMWIGRLSDPVIELVWEEGADIPDPENIEVRTYPSAWGWFGYSVDRRREICEMSEDGRKWTYKGAGGESMDFAYNVRVPTATEIVTVFSDKECSVPEIRIKSDSVLGEWKKCTFRVEWGFNENCPGFDGITEAYLGLVSEVSFDRENKRAVYTCLYSETARYGGDSKFTLICNKEKNEGATVLLRKVAKEPICVPELGIYFCPDDLSMSAEEYIASQKALNKKTLRDKVKEHREAENWEELIKNVRLWRCPEGTELTPFPEAPKASVEFHVPDKRFETMYELAIEQLRGPHMWGNLACEVARVTMTMEMLGLEAEADIIYDYFLDCPGVKSDGDFSTGKGAFEWAKAMRHDMGYSHDGTHASTGKLLYSMMYRYLLSGNEEWLKERLPRFKEAADWIINETKNYMKDVPNREQLHCYGILPPSMLGDYALPACDWRWYYVDNAFAQMGLRLFAEVLRRVKDPEAQRYIEEVAIFENNFKAVIEREALYAPVREGGDGMSRSYLPRMAYAGGLLHYADETNIPQFAMGICDLFVGALSLADFNALYDAKDRRIVGALDAMTETGAKVSLAGLEKLAHPVADEKIRENEEKLAKASQGEGKACDPPTEDLWFWNTMVNLPKSALNANVFLRQDDIPNFLYFFLNHAVIVVGSNGKMWEHSHPDVYVDCENPDNGSAAWFVENFRNMLAVEDGDELWIMKGTPRAWLRQGEVIEAVKVPTFFGKLSYKMESNTDNKEIKVLIDMPERILVPVTKLRLRHPDAKRIKDIAIVGTAKGSIDADGETISLIKAEGKLEIIAKY